MEYANIHLHKIKITLKLALLMEIMSRYQPFNKLSVWEGVTEDSGCGFAKHIQLTNVFEVW